MYFLVSKCSLQASVAVSSELLTFEKSCIKVVSIGGGDLCDWICCDHKITGWINMSWVSSIFYILSCMYVNVALSDMQLSIYSSHLTVSAFTVLCRFQLWHLSRHVLQLCFFNLARAFSALTLLVGWQEGHPDCKNWAVGCWHGCLSGTRCSLAYGPADATATHCLLLP